MTSVSMRTITALSCTAFAVSLLTPSLALAGPGAGDGSGGDPGVESASSLGTAGGYGIGAGGIGGYSTGGMGNAGKGAQGNGSSSGGGASQGKAQPTTVAPKTVPTVKTPKKEDVVTKPTVMTIKEDIQKVLNMVPTVTLDLNVTNTKTPKAVEDDATAKVRSLAPPATKAEDDAAAKAAAIANSRTVAEAKEKAAATMAAAKAENAKAAVEKAMAEHAVDNPQFSKSTTFSPPSTAPAAKSPEPTGFFSGFFGAAGLGPSMGFGLGL